MVSDCDCTATTTSVVAGRWCAFGRPVQRMRLFGASGWHLMVMGYRHCDDGRRGVAAVLGRVGHSHRGLNLWRERASFVLSNGRPSGVMIAMGVPTRSMTAGQLMERG